ncbi:unnamed protein product [Symbiodinium natans]|uniref:EF-hand domain-containing protein n=1 Tax=Symbiodinium natans TaxID=878477 RepID=A0A812U0G4_9DINO|nr:unnamed protein product [Symbiodinium natans]
MLPKEKRSKEQALPFVVLVQDGIDAPATDGAVAVGPSSTRSQAHFFGGSKVAPEPSCTGVLIFLGGLEILQRKFGDDGCLECCGLNWSPEDSSSTGVEVKPKKVKAKKEKKDKKADFSDEARPDANEGEPEYRRPSQAEEEEEPLAEFPDDEEDRVAEDYKESVDEPVATLLVEPFVGEQSLQPGREEQETGVMPEGSDGEVRVDLTEETEVDPLMRDEPRTSHASHVQSVPAEDIITGPPPIVLGGSGDDVNIPDREIDGPRRYTLGGQEKVHRCTQCDLVWDAAVMHCSKCQRPLVEATIKVTEFLSNSQLEFLEQAFKRYDVDGSGRLDGKELRMAVRELGWDTKQDILDRWARVGGNQGLNLDQFKNLVASGKLGKKTFKAIVGKASEAVRDDRRQLLAMGGAAPQFTARQRQGRRGALVPGETQDFLPDGGLVSTAPPFGEGQSAFEELPPHRKLELTEAWAFWDADHSGFLEPIELMNASKGLGFHLPIESVVAVCGKHGGGIDQENFIRVMSVQIKHRDEELGLWKGSPLDWADWANDDDDVEDSTTFRAKRKKELAKAELNLRRTSVTDMNFRWRNLLCTTHATVGEYAIGVRLYFDLLLLLVIAFGVLTGTTLPFLVMCGSSSGGGPVLKQTDEVLSTLAKYSVGNLARSPAADATVHIMNEFFGSMALLGVLLLYRFVIIHRATYTTNSRNLANLAVQVRGLPTDLGYHHLGYEELLREHFQTVAYEQALRMGTANELDDQPVREVVLWRNYDSAVQGVLQQVELQAKQYSVNTELKFLEQKAREHNLSDDLEHDLGYNAGGGLAPTSGRRQSTKGRQTMKVMAERQSAASDMSVGDDDSTDFSHAVTTTAERMYDRMCTRTDGGRRLAKRQTYLLSMNDLIEEQILEIETERALHSDLKPDEREVMGAFVVFWCQRTRDAVLGQYGWSRSWCCRACCQRRRLRLKLPFEESSDGSEGAPDEEEVAFPLIVEATQDPSLQLWQNMDVKPMMRLIRGCMMSICRFLVLNLIFIVACITVSTHIYYPLFLPIDAKVWLITNVSEPVANSSSNSAPCWRVCELELFGDELCSDRKAPYMFARR